MFVDVASCRCGDAGWCDNHLMHHTRRIYAKHIQRGTQSHKITQEHIHTLEMFYVLFICDKFGGTHMHAQLKQFLPKPFIPHICIRVWRIEMAGRMAVVCGVVS